MSIMASIGQSLLSQGTVIAVFVGVAYIFRETILRLVNDRISLASRKDLQAREHEFKTQFDGVRRNFERIQSTQEGFLTAFLEVSSERGKSVAIREIEAAEAIWASVETLNRLLPSTMVADMLKFDAIEELETSERAKFKQLASIFTKELTPEFMAKASCQSARLYVNDTAWAFYHAYVMIVFSGGLRMIALETGFPTSAFDRAALKKAILDALPHQKPTLEKHPNMMNSLFLDELREALLKELKKSIRGEQSTERESAIARAILSELPNEVPMPTTNQASATSS